MKPFNYRTLSMAHGTGLIACAINSAQRVKQRASIYFYALSLLLTAAAMGVFAYQAAEHLSALYAAGRLHSIVDLGNGNFTELDPAIFQTLSTLGDFQAVTRTPSLLASTYSYIEYAIALCVFLCTALTLVLVFKTVQFFYARHFSIPARFRKAMNANAPELCVQFQPIVNIKNGQWIGAEALLRWSINNQAQSPAVFIPALETAGIMPHVTRWVCTQVAQAHAEVIWACKDFYVTVNLSADDVLDATFPEFIAKLCIDYGLLPSRLCFEVTESVLLDVERARPQLMRLRQQGHLIALDDFGTGYSSLSYLENLPADIVKLDRSFITKDENHANSTILSHIVSMARSMGLKVIAEGVETQEQVSRLAYLHTYAAQGWLYSKDLKAEALVRGFFACHHPDLDRVI